MDKKSIGTPGSKLHKGFTKWLKEKIKEDKRRNHGK